MVLSYRLIVTASLKHYISYFPLACSADNLTRSESAINLLCIVVLSKRKEYSDTRTESWSLAKKCSNAAALQIHTYLNRSVTDFEHCYHPLVEYGFG